MFGLIEGHSIQSNLHNEVVEGSYNITGHLRANHRRGSISTKPVQLIACVTVKSLRTHWTISKSHDNMIYFSFTLLHGQCDLNLYTENTN